MNLDIWYHILSFLNNDLDKINLIRTCKNMIQANVIFTEQHELIQIMKSSLYNNYSDIHFTSGIYLSNYPDFSFPKNMKKSLSMMDLIKVLKEYIRAHFL